MEEKNYKFCQSCGFPLKKDKQGGGTEKDGSISKKYCSMCYKNGEFLTPPEIDTPKKNAGILYSGNEEVRLQRVYCLVSNALDP